MCACMCATWIYCCPWDRSQPLKLQTASISTSEMDKKHYFHTKWKPRSHYVLFKRRRHLWFWCWSNVACTPRLMDPSTQLKANPLKRLILTYFYQFCFAALWVLLHWSRSSHFKSAVTWDWCWSALSIHKFNILTCFLYKWSGCDLLGNNVRAICVFQHC